MERSLDGWTLVVTLDWYVCSCICILVSVVPLFVYFIFPVIITCSFFMFFVGSSLEVISSSTFSSFFEVTAGSTVKTLSTYDRVVF